MAAPAPALSADWLVACRRSVSGLRAVLDTYPTTRERARETGRGEGGDQALIIDRAAEDAVFAQLESLREQGHRFTAISEERGEVGFGDETVRVIIDPIDGSLNAKRGLPHHALSIAVADGPTMADVDFAYVYDFGPGEEWWARRGAGAWRNGERLGTEPGERRDAAGRLEVVGIESADPRWVAESAGELAGLSHRLRALGAIAITLCQVAAARLDGMVSLKRCRAVDAAAGQLVVREAGGLVAFPFCSAPLAAPLDVRPHSPVVAARTQEGLAELCAIHAGGAGAARASSSRT
jgi:myo-inositol-1(or 4)-monophosphatase